MLSWLMHRSFQVLIGSNTIFGTRLMFLTNGFSFFRVIYLNCPIKMLRLWQSYLDVVCVSLKTYFYLFKMSYSVQFYSVTQSCLTPCDPMDCGMPGLLVYHQLLEFTQIHVHWVGDAIQPSHPLSSPSPSAVNLSQHQGLFQWVSFSHQVAKVLEFQL